MNRTWQPMGETIAKIRTLGAKHHSREEGEEVFWKYPFEVPIDKNVLWPGCCCKHESHLNRLAS